jgi:hypothetical protein
VDKLYLKHRKNRDSKKVMFMTKKTKPKHEEEILVFMGSNYHIYQYIQVIEALQKKGKIVVVAENNELSRPMLRTPVWVYEGNIGFDAIPVYLETEGIIVDKYTLGVINPEKEKRFTELWMKEALQSSEDIRDLIGLLYLEYIGLSKSEAEILHKGSYDIKISESNEFESAYSKLCNIHVGSKFHKVKEEDFFGLYPGIRIKQYGRSFWTNVSKIFPQDYSDEDIDYLSLHTGSPYYMVKEFKYNNPTPFLHTILEIPFREYEYEIQRYLLIQKYLLENNDRI